MPYRPVSRTWDTVRGTPIRPRMLATHPIGGLVLPNSELNRILEIDGALGTYIQTVGKATGMWRFRSLASPAITSPLRLVSMHSQQSCYIETMNKISCPSRSVYIKPEQDQGQTAVMWSCDSATGWDAKGSRKFQSPSEW
jgi:hypothetical protein